MNRNLELGVLVASVQKTTLRLKRRSLQLGGLLRTQKPTFSLPL